jgi:NADH:ubiquinone oxidoreductase subunit H
VLIPYLSGFISFELFFFVCTRLGVCVVMTAGCVVMTAGCVVMTAGCVVMTAGCVVMTAGFVVMTAGFVVMTAGCVVMTAGWSSNSGNSLLIGLRSLAQTISYEVRLAFILFSFVVLVWTQNSLHNADIM